MALSKESKARIAKHVEAALTGDIPEVSEDQFKTAKIVRKVPVTNYQSPTQETYNGLEEAFRFYNEQLFEGKLPEVFFTIHRKRKAHGYFWAEQFNHREDGHRLHEIALNPESMGRTMEEIMGTLVHEMCHLWQQEFGKAPKRVYHDKQFAEQMEKVGLICSANGQPGGKKTGRNMTHYVDEHGPFAALKPPVTLPYFTQPQIAAAKKKDESKVKHSCPCCNANVWGKRGINVMCGECDEKMEAE